MCALGGGAMLAMGGGQSLARIISERRVGGTADGMSARAAAMPAEKQGVPPVS